MRCLINKMLILCCLWGMWACETDREPLVEAKMEERIERKMQEYERIYKQRCVDDLQAEAIHLADSLVRLQIQLLPLDSLRKPPKPFKPNYPGSQRHRDTFFVKRPTG